MRSFFLTIAMLLSLALLGCGSEPAQQQADDKQDPQSSATDSNDVDGEAGETVQIVNDKCPICGMKVDPSLGTIEYEGKHYGVGCEACIDEFRNNKAKYVNQIEEAQDAAAPPAG